MSKRHDMHKLMFSFFQRPKPAPQKLPSRLGKELLLDGLRTVQRDLNGPNSQKTRWPVLESRRRL